MYFKDNEIGKLIRSNIQNLIDKKIIKNEEDLEDPALDIVEQIANELNICIKDIVCCYCTLDKCIGDRKCCAQNPHM